MKTQRKFSVSGLVTAALVAAVMFGCAAPVLAQTDSAASGAHTRYQQGAVPSTPPAVTFTTLVTFDGTNGANPGLSPIQGTDGNLYGGTAGGGEYSQGVLFKMTPSGTLTVLYNFCAESGCPDGKGGAPEVLGSDANLYGSTGGGGASNDGTIFKFTEHGTLTTLHSFDGSDGSGAEAGLIQANDGNFYGTTSGFGGSNLGTVFRITPSGELTVLHNFEGTDGQLSYAPLVQGSNGDLYGTTEFGADMACSEGCGTVFRVADGLNP